jgi:hypothetical protein
VAGLQPIRAVGASSSSSSSAHAGASSSSSAPGADAIAGASASASTSGRIDRAIKERPGWFQFPVEHDGEMLGALVSNGVNMNAHCFSTSHCSGGASCHTDRLLREGRRPAQGRPLGLLVAWLLRHSKHATKSSHQDIKPLLSSRNGYAERCRAREWLKAQGGFQEAFALERPSRDGESSEPEVAC